MGTKYTTQTKAIRQYKKKLHIKHSTIQVQPTFLYKFQPFFSSSTLHLVNKYILFKNVYIYDSLDLSHSLWFFLFKFNFHSVFFLFLFFLFVCLSILFNRIFQHYGQQHALHTLS